MSLLFVGRGTALCLALRARLGASAVLGLALLPLVRLPLWLWVAPLGRSRLWREMALLVWVAPRR